MSMSGPQHNPTAATFSRGTSPGPHLDAPDPDDYVDPTREQRAGTSFVLGLLGVFPFGILAGIPAIVLGVHALRRIKAAEGTIQGRTLAWCGIVLGIASIPTSALMTYLVVR